MSATPRPWEIDKFWEEGPWALKRADAELIVRAVNAFDALLAVAKAADRRDETLQHHCRLCGVGVNHRPPTGHTVACPLAQLDATHPDWREWVAP